MQEHNDNLSINIGVIDFTQTITVKLKTASLFLPENLTNAVAFSDLLMVVEPPSDWLLQNQEQLAEVLVCLIISKEGEAPSKLKTIHLPQSAPYSLCILDLADAFNQPSMVSVGLGDFITIISQGSRLFYYQSSWLTSPILELNHLSPHLKELDDFYDIKGLFTVASLSRDHAHSIDAYIEIADFVRDKSSENTVTAARYTLPLTIQEAEPA